jgi:hypothetical protein
LYYWTVDARPEKPDNMTQYYNICASMPRITTRKYLSTLKKYQNHPRLKDLDIFYCQIYTIGLNTIFTTYMKFSPVSYEQRSDREHDG